MITVEEDKDTEKRDDSGVVGVLGVDSLAVLTVRLGSSTAVVGGVVEVTVPLNSVNDEEDGRGKGNKGEKTTHGENRHSVVHLVIGGFHFICPYFLKKNIFF
jgi:hypothetical protein